jgi:hypothetical protein
MKKRTGPWLLASSIALALLVSPFAIAAGEGKSLLGGARNPGANETQELTRETEIIANTPTYGTRQSNKSDNGGGAIYGCRSKAGGTPANNEPCVRASNLADGRAFEFESKGGKEVGAIVSSNPNAAPFTTNARGVATGLNADQVDGKSADDLTADATKAAQALTLFAAVGADGKLAGGRSATSAARTAEGTYTVTFNTDISACALSATQTQLDNAGAVGVQLGDDKKTVSVRTRAGGGADGLGATAIADRSFHLTVSC